MWVPSFRRNVLACFSMRGCRRTACSETSARTWLVAVRQTILRRYHRLDVRVREDAPPCSWLFYRRLCGNRSRATAVLEIAKPRGPRWAGGREVVPLGFVFEALTAMTLKNKIFWRAFYWLLTLLSWRRRLYIPPNACELLPDYTVFYVWRHARPTGRAKRLFSVCRPPELLRKWTKCGLSFVYCIYYDAVSTADVIECQVLSLGCDRCLEGLRKTKLRLRHPGGETPDRRFPL
jgi:hypothetical protein